MKKYFHPARLPLYVPILGALGLALRLWLQSTADSKGFLPSGHPALVLLMLVSAAALVLVFLLTRPLIEAAKYRFNFPASQPGALGILAGGIGIGAVCLLELLLGTQGVDTLCAVFGIASALALFLAARFRKEGLQPIPLLYALVSVFFMLRLICYYRTYSADPVLVDYCFQLLALVCLMLASYQRAAFCANIGSRRAFTFFSLFALYCCCLSLTGWKDILFFLPAGFWMATDLCSLLPAPSRKKQEEG